MAGKVGRPAKPSNVHFLHGNPSKKRPGELLDDFTPDTCLPPAPDCLSEVGREHYDQIGKELERYGLISEIDVGMLTMLSQAWSDYVWAREKIREHNAADEEHREAGMVASTPNGYKVMSVYLQQANAAQKQYQKLAAEFGLSPSNRSRVRAGDPQMQLPGFEQPDDSGPSLASFA